MKIYSSHFLIISHEKENSRFVQSWVNSPDEISDFKNEMLKYTSLYKRYKPEQSLWLQKKFELSLDSHTQLWIEDNVNVPCKEYGNKKLAFVVSKDVLAHIEVINSFEETKSCIVPKHFVSMRNAINWLNEDVIEFSTLNKISFTFEGVDEEGFGIIKVKSPSANISQTLRSLKNIIQTNEYVKSNLSKYVLLTQREKEVLELYVTVHSPREIANQLCVTLHTMRTHWKNIKKKLNFQSNEEILMFAKAFNSINTSLD